MSNLTNLQFKELFQVLQDSMDAKAREHAREKLLEIDEEILIGFLGKVVKNDTDTEVLAYAAELIVDSNNKQRANYILPLLQYKDPILRRHICGLLGNCRDKVAVDPLIEKLQSDASADVRVIAAYALGKIGDRKALPFLTRARTALSFDFEGVTVSKEASYAIDEIENNQMYKQL